MLSDANPIRQHRALGNAVYSLRYCSSNDWERQRTKGRCGELKTHVAGERQHAT